MHINLSHVTSTLPATGPCPCNLNVKYRRENFKPSVLTHCIVLFFFFTEFLPREEYIRVICFIESAWYELFKGFTLILYTWYFWGFKQIYISSLPVLLWLYKNKANKFHSIKDRSNWKLFSNPDLHSRVSFPISHISNDWILSLYRYKTVYHLYLNPFL